MPAMPLSICSRQSEKAETPVASNKFPECETCVNREFDPFACEECEDADLYEPEDEGAADYAEAVDMNISEFKHYWETNNGNE